MWQLAAEIYRCEGKQALLYSQVLLAQNLHPFKFQLQTGPQI